MPARGGRGRGEDIFPLLPPPHRRQGRQYQLYLSLALRPGSPTSLSTESTLLCCPGEVYGLLLKGFQPVRTGTILPSVATSEGQGQFCTALSSQPLVISGAMDTNRDLGGIRAMNPDKGLSSSALGSYTFIHASNCNLLKCG